jgi:hypothetical protein
MKSQRIGVERRSITRERSGTSVDSDHSRLLKIPLCSTLSPTEIQACGRSTEQRDEEMIRDGCNERRCNAEHEKDKKTSRRIG